MRRLGEFFHAPRSVEFSGRTVADGEGTDTRSLGSREVERRGGIRDDTEDEGSRLNNEVRDAVGQGQWAA